MTRTAFATCRCLLTDEGGATTIEYALLASMLAIGAFAALMSYGGSMTNLYSGFVNAILAVAPAGP